jgi:hypothetical protein
MGTEAVKAQVETFKKYHLYNFRGDEDHNASSVAGRPDRSSACVPHSFDSNSSVGSVIKQFARDTVTDMPGIGRQSG